MLSIAATAQLSMPNSPRVVLWLAYVDLETELTATKKSATDGN